MSVCSAVRFPRTYGVPWRNAVPPGVLPVVTLVGGFTELDRSSTEEVSGDFTVLRAVNSQRQCSVEWRVEGVGDDPVLASYFAGGVLPSGLAFFVPGLSSLPFSLLLSTGGDPARTRSGRVVLENADSCVISAGADEFLFTIKAAVIGAEPVVGLDVPFTDLERAAGSTTLYQFSILRGIETSGACSVGWRLDGTGSNPLLAADFVGAALPSGTASFGASDIIESASFSITAGSPPATRRTGQIVLHTPVSCKIDPFADDAAVGLVGDEIVVPSDLFEPTLLADLPGSRKTNVSAGGTYTGVAGQNFALTADLTGVTITLRGTGTAALPIVFRGNVDSKNASALRRLTNCTINLEGTFCGLAYVEMSNCTINYSGSDNFVCRTNYSNRNGGFGNHWIDFNGRRASFHHNTTNDRLGRMAASLCKGPFGNGVVIAENLFENWSNNTLDDKNTYVFYIGTSESTTNDFYDVDIRDNLFLNSPIPDLGEFKSSRIQVRRNTITNCGAAGWRIRHGIGTRIEEELFVGGFGDIITVRTGPHYVLNNQSQTEAGGETTRKIVLYAGNLSWDYDVWKTQRIPGSGNNFQAAGRCQVGGNHARVLVGKRSATELIYEKYKAFQNNVGTAGGPDRNRLIEFGPQEGTTRSTVAGADYSKVLRRRTRTDTGLAA